MKCQHCAMDLPENATACPYCGQQQNAQPAQQAPAWELTAGQESCAAPANDQPPLYDSNGVPNASQVPADAQPHHGRVSFFTAIKYSFVHIVDFTHRASRSEFWWGYLFWQVVSIILAFIPVVGTALSAAVSLPIVSMTVRRFHDAGVHWKNIFRLLIPVYGIVFMIQTCVRPSVGDNEFGYGPRE